MKQQRIYVRPDPELSREDDIDRIVDTLLGWFADQAGGAQRPAQAAVFGAHLVPGHLAAQVLLGSGEQVQVVPRHRT